MSFKNIETICVSNTAESASNTNPEESWFHVFVTRADKTGDFHLQGIVDEYHEATPLVLYFLSMNTLLRVLLQCTMTNICKIVSLITRHYMTNNTCSWGFSNCALNLLLKDWDKLESYSWNSSNAAEDNWDQNIHTNTFTPINIILWLRHFWQ